MLSRKNPKETSGFFFRTVLLFLSSDLVTAYTRVKKVVCRTHSNIEILKLKVNILGTPLCFPFASRLGNFGD